MKYSFSYLNTPDNLYSFCYENFNTLKDEKKQLLLTRVIKKQDILEEKKIHYANNNQLRNIKKINSEYNGSREKFINVTNNRNYMKYYKKNKKIELQKNKELMSDKNQKNIYSYKDFTKLNTINKQIKNHIGNNKTLYGFTIPKRNITINNQIYNIKGEIIKDNISIKQDLLLSYKKIKKQHNGVLKTDNKYSITDIKNYIKNSNHIDYANFTLKDVNYNVKKNDTYLLQLLNNNINDFIEQSTSKVLSREQRFCYNSSNQNKILNRDIVSHISNSEKALYDIVKNVHKNIDDIDNIKQFIKTEQSNISNYNTVIFDKNKKNHKEIDNTREFNIYHTNIIKNIHKKISNFKNYRNVSDTIRGNFYLENKRQHINKTFKEITNINTQKRNYINKSDKGENLLLNEIYSMIKQIDKRVHFHSDTNKAQITKNIHKKININTIIQNYQKNHNKQFHNKTLNINYIIKSYSDNNIHTNIDFDNIKIDIVKNTHKEMNVCKKEHNLNEHIKGNIDDISNKMNNRLISTSNKNINENIKNDINYGEIHTYQNGQFNDDDKLLQENMVNNANSKQDLQSYFIRNIQHNINESKRENILYKRPNKNIQPLSKKQYELKSQDKNIYVEDKERLGALYKRLWFIKGMGEIDYKILPNIDYKYPAPINIFVEQPDFEYYFEYKTFCDEYFNGEYIIELYDYDYNTISILKTNNVSEKEVGNDIISLKISKEVFNEISENEREHYKFEIKINYPKVNYIIIRQPTNTFDNEVLYTVTEKFLGENKHPIPFGNELGLREIPIHINIMVEFINVLLLLWQQRFVAFGGLLGIHGIYGLVNLVYEWLTLETSIENNEYIEEYNRCFRWLRWEAEKTYNLAKADTKLNANNWINFMINEMIDYVEMHHIDVIPILEKIMDTDDWRNQFHDATIDIKIILDKMKGKRKRIISNKKMTLSSEPTKN